MKNQIRKLLGFAGYEIRRKFRADSIDPFDVQKSLVRRDEPMIFDVGASVGGVTQKYRELFPRALIHSFEPLPEAFAELKRATTGDPLTSVHNLAVADKEGVIEFNINSFAPTSSLLPTDDRGAGYWGEGLLKTERQLEVKSTSIDYFRTTNSIAHIDILKLDIQGGEFLALSGASQTLGKQLISIIYSEVIIAPTYQGQRKLHEYLSLLDSLNYDLFDIYNPVRKDRQLLQADVLFVSRNLLSMA